MVWVFVMRMAWSPSRLSVPALPSVNCQWAAERPGGAPSVVEVLDRVVGLLLGELAAVLGGELIVDRVRGHVQRFPVGLRGLERVLVPVRVDVVDRVLRGLLGILVVIRGELVVDVLLGHVQHVRVGLGALQRGDVIGGHVVLRLLLGLSGLILGSGIFLGGGCRIRRRGGLRTVVLVVAP